MINFDEQTHTYTNEKGKVLISVTQLLKLAGISPNYDFVNEEVLKAAADKGSLIHKEIEDYIKELRAKDAAKRDKEEAAARGQDAVQLTDKDLMELLKQKEQAYAQNNGEKIY